MNFYLDDSNLKYGLVHDLLDYQLSRNSSIRYWHRKRKEIPNYVKFEQMFDFEDKNAKEIVLESLPGHVHFSYLDDELWFGACWQMYFSNLYYKFIPKALFDGFIDCEENIIFENGVRRITLFNNPDDFDLPENRARQWAFRRKLGIDTIGHEIGKGENLISDDLPVYITKKNCKIGHTKVIKYLDKNKNLINKKDAIWEENKEYLEDGITLVSEELNQIKKGFFGFYLIK
jgi:hypothetical protein